VAGFLALTPGLTECRCECCGRVEYDNVAHLLVAEAVLTFVLSRRAKQEHDRNAFREAQRQIDSVKQSLRQGG
jgi:hypothetical protein